MKEDGGPAFPTMPYKDEWKHDIPGTSGLSLRDYFAAQALAGICANSEITLALGEIASDANVARQKVAEAAFATADAMLEARKK